MGRVAKSAEQKSKRQMDQLPRIHRKNQRHSNKGLAAQAIATSTLLDVVDGPLRRRRRYRTDSERDTIRIAAAPFEAQVDRVLPIRVWLPVKVGLLTTFA